MLDLKTHKSDDVINSIDDRGMIYRRLNDYHDVQIFTSILIGEKKTAFKMIFDSGSSVMWVFSSKCSTCPSYQNLFNQDESKTLKVISSSEIHESYGVG